jgi:class 3 adenylate cyclase
VNVAARIAEQAKPGQILVTPEVVDRVRRGDIAFEPVGSFVLKGVSRAIPLHAVSAGPVAHRRRAAQAKPA